jgi:hypothetical protein
MGLLSFKVGLSRNRNQSMKRLVYIISILAVLCLSLEGRRRFVPALGNLGGGGGPPPPPTIAFDAASGGATAGTTTLTVSHTCSGTNRVLIVVVSTGGGTGDTVSGVTYNGLAMTNLWDAADGTLALGSGWMIVDPPTGTHNIVATFGASLSAYGELSATSWTGVDQLTVKRASPSVVFPVSAEPTITASSATNGDTVVDGWAIYNYGTAISPNQTSRNVSTNAGQFISAIQSAVATGPTVMSWTSVDTVSVGCAVVLIPAPVFNGLINEGFEGVGLPAGWFAGGGDDPDYAGTVINGAQSAHGTSGQYFHYNLVADKDELWCKCKFRMPVLNTSPSASFAPIYFNDDAFTQLPTCYIFYDGSVTTDFVTYLPAGTVVANTTYYFWFHYRKGPSGIDEAWFNTTDDRTTALHLSNSGPGTNQIQGFYFCNPSGGAEYICDDLQVADFDFQ